MDTSRPELEKRADGEYFWNLRPGKPYNLGSHWGISVSEGTTREVKRDVTGFYAGSQDGRLVFFEKTSGGNILRYSANPIAAWMGGGEDDPCYPIIDAVRDELIMGDLQRSFIRNQIHNWQQRIKQAA